MMGPTHSIVGGTSAFVATSAAGLSWGYVGAASALCAAGSSIPDLDQKWPLKHLVRHRKTTHRPSLQLAFFALLAAGVAAVYPAYAELAVLAGAPLALACVMHSCVDAMTVHPDGIELLWPISRRGYHLLPRSLRVWVGSKSRSEKPRSLRVWVGSKLRSEKVFVAVWVGFVLIYAYAHFGRLISA